MCAYMAILFQHISCTHSVPNSFSLEREAKLHYISTQRAAAAAMKFTAPLPQHTCYPPSLFWSVFTCLCIVSQDLSAELSARIAPPPPSYRDKPTTNTLCHYNTK